PARERPVSARCGCIAFFFQAEGGIRDFHVTGVQTCALPICLSTDHRSPNVTTPIPITKTRADAFCLTKNQTRPKVIATMNADRQASALAKSERSLIRAAPS